MKMHAPGTSCAQLVSKDRLATQVRSKKSLLLTALWKELTAPL